MNQLRRHIRLPVWLLCLVVVGFPQYIAAEDPAPPLHRQIDELVNRRLTVLKITPAEISSDAEFMRRIYLDLTGVIPTAGQARTFLDDSTPDKRQRLIDELLASPDYAIQMARVFDVMLIERRIPSLPTTCRRRSGVPI